MRKHEQEWRGGKKSNSRELPWHRTSFFFVGCGSAPRAQRAFAIIHSYDSLPGSREGVPILDLLVIRVEFTMAFAVFMQDVYITCVSTGLHRARSFSLLHLPRRFGHVRSSPLPRHCHCQRVVVGWRYVLVRMGARSCHFVMDFSVLNHPS